MCRPTILPLDERVSVVDEGYDVSLALRLYQPEGTPDARARQMARRTAWTASSRTPSRSTMWWSRLDPDRPGSGKTTYTRAVGLAHVLFQAASLSPGPLGRLRSRRRHPHPFPSREQVHPGDGTPGRGGRAPGRNLPAGDALGLVLLNETLAGTAAREAEALARDRRPGPPLLGARAVYVTHLRPGSVRRRAERDDAGASLVGSLVADADDEASRGSVTRGARFESIPRAPRGRSFASDIARRYGIGYPQLALLRERGLAATDGT